MRNLKRVLSLTLASVMLLGMMVVGAGAAGYPDVSDEDNVEAIEVLQAVEVMVGDENGNFGPEQQVNRAQMAVIMANLLDLDYDYYQGQNIFWDVPAWAAPYAAACYANGIILGYGGTTFGAADPVTAVQAASMMMRALGYFQYESDYEGSFELSTVKQASKIRLFDNVDASAKDALNRGEVAQLALNALKTPIVEAEDNTLHLTSTTGDATINVSGGQVNYVVTASNQAYARAIGKDEVSGTGLNQVDGYIIELGEQLYNGKLELVDHDLDDFGRPARTWKYDGAEIGSYAKKELLVKDYTVKVTGRMVYELLGQTTIRDNDVDSYLDGHTTEILRTQLVRSNESGLVDTSRSNVATTGRGVLTEVYLETDIKQITIVSINTYLAKATTDYNENSETITLNVYNGFSGITKIVDLEDVPAIQNMKKDDWVLVNWADADASAQSKVVVNTIAPEIITDVQVTAFSRSTNEEAANYGETGLRVTDITADGNEYKNNVNAWYKYTTLYDYNADLMVDKTYTLYLDQFGNFIGAELYSGENQYVFITGYDRPQSNISVSTATASAIFTDGTMAAISVNVKDTDSNIQAYNNRRYPSGYTEASCDYIRWTQTHPAESQMGKGSNEKGNPYENMWYKYTVKNDVYTLSPVDYYTKEVNENPLSGDEKTINCSNVRLVKTANGVSSPNDNRAYGEDDSVYITVDDGDVDYLPNNAVVEVTGRYTGVQNVNLVYQPQRWVHSVNNEDGFIVAAIVYGEAEGVVDNYAYIRSGVKKEWTEDGTHYWNFEAILNGELVVKTIKSRFSNTVNTLSTGTVQELVLDADGYVTTIKNVPNGEGVNDQDDVYSNYDYLQTSDNNAALLKDYEVYDITIGTVNNGGNQTIGSLMSNGRYCIDLSVSGRTLHYDRAGTDLGLDFTSEAKAVTRQIINNESKWQAYTGTSAVQTAFNTLVDADGNTGNNTNGVKQFSGRIVAVLNSDGVAEWVFFDDFTPVKSSDPNYGGNTPTITGEKVTARTTVAEVNALLSSGKDVIVSGTWLPSDCATTGQLLKIPAGRTLRIEGDFAVNAQTGLVSIDAIDSTSKLDVTGEFTVSAKSSPKVNYTVTAGSMKIVAPTNTITISAPVTVKGNLDVANTNSNVIIARNTTVKVNGSVTGDASNVIQVYGTLDVNGNLGASTNVYSLSSLIVRGSVTNNAIITVGDGSEANNGYVSINKMTSGSKLVINNTTTAKASTVATVDSGAILDVQKGALEVTGKLDTAKVAVAVGGTLTIKAGAELGTNSKFETETTSDKVAGTVSSSLVIAPTAAKVGSTDGDTAIEVPDSQTSVPVASPSDGQPTTVSEAESISSDMPNLANYFTLNLKEEYTANASYDAEGEASATNVKGTIKLVGKVTSFTGDSLTEAAMNDYAPADSENESEKTRGWEDAAEGDSSHTAEGFKTVYDLEGKEYGFVLVSVNDTPYQLMVVKQGSSWKIQTRVSSAGENYGKLSYWDSRSLNFGTAENKLYYTVDVTGLY